MPEFYVSAPGKVILFGEHSAVYGKPAIAAALSLRAYLLVKPSAVPDEIVLEFPDIKLIHRWKTDEIPWEKLAAVVPKSDGVPKPTDELVPEILNLLADLLADCESTLHYTACRCFLYLYANLCGPNVTGHHFCIRSTLPIGAGLGSSASTAVSLAAALSVLGNHISDPTHGLTDRVTHKTSPDAEFIDAWSFMGEKCFHGNPSGIDNAVATHGGAVLYQRQSGPATPSIRTNIRNFAALKLLLTNTKVPRSTAELVGGVAKQNARFPRISNAILDAMAHLATAAFDLMMEPQLNKADLCELVKINHGLLVSLGVSHPKLEQIRLLTDTHKLGATKLTGAGGGGCAITLLADDVSDERLQQVRREFEDDGLETFSTMLGGKGVGMLRAIDAETEQQFSTESLASLETREDIEKLVGPSAVAGWKFW